MDNTGAKGEIRTRDSGVLKPVPITGAFTSRLLSHMVPESGVKPNTQGV